MIEQLPFQRIPHLSFIGPIGGPELILIFLVIAVLLIVPAIILAIALSSKRTASATPPANSSAEFRLAELEDLKTKKLISEEEYQQQRKSIIAKL